MKTKTQKLVMAAMFAALCFIATTIIKIPSPFKGYLNLGDCVVLASSWILSPLYAFLSAGIGSALADVASGYVIYAPATFVIKGLMTIISHYIYRLSKNKYSNLSSRIFGGVSAELFMVLGYFLFEGVLYGFIPSLVNIPVNAVQGVAGLILGVLSGSYIIKKFIDYV